jgi:uncharacterized membrane protein YdjX (TVP38/TMEM64 family)
VPDQDAPPAAEPPTSRLAIALTLAGVAVVVALVLLVPALHDAAGAALRGDTGALRSQLRDLGAWGVVVLLGVMLAHCVLWYPAEIPTAAAGFVYGFWQAMPIVLGGWLMSAVATYFMGRFAGRPALRRIAGERRFDRVEQAIARGGVPVLLAARLVPVVPFSLTGYVAGAVRVRLWTFAWTTMVGFLPLTIVVTLLGSRLEELSLSDPLLWAALVPLAGLLLFAKPLAARMRLPAERES